MHNLRAADIAQAHKRKTIGPEDIFTALESLDFEFMIPALKEQLHRNVDIM